MDIAQKRTYIGIRVAKAQDDLVTARLNAEHGRWRGATNRTYYAVFHVVSAALLWLDIERRKHAAVQATFHEFMIKSGLIEVEYGQI